MSDDNGFPFLVIFLLVVVVGVVLVDPFSSAPPTAALKVSPTRVSVGKQVTLDARGSSAAHGRMIRSFTWNTGDHSPTLKTDKGVITHIYKSPGTYTVRVVVTDDRGEAKEATQVVTVTGRGPTARVYAQPTSGKAPLKVAFDASASDPGTGGSIVMYQWLFGDKSPTATGKKVTHTYTSPGTYRATLKVLTQDGAIASSYSETIHVSGTLPPLTVSIHAKATSGYVPFTVYLDGTGSSQDGAHAMSFLWNFGDGSSTTGSTVEHTFTTEGTYLVSVKVTTDLGSVKQDSIKVTVLPRPPDNTSPDWSPTSDVIAYVSNADSTKTATNWEIYTVLSTGANVTRVTNNLGKDSEPVWSPDGNRLAFVSDRDQQSGEDIYIMDLSAGVDKRVVTRLTFRDSGNDMDPCWLPATDRPSRAILFVSDRDGNLEIYRMDIVNRTWTRLTYSSADERHPTISPDGKHVAFQQNIGGNWEILTMDINGTNIKRLTFNPAADVTPKWSPDGKRIAFATNRDGNWEIYSMDADGGNKRNLTNNPADDTNPDWSPDGTALTFESNRAGVKEIFTMTQWGEKQRMITGVTK